MFLFPPELCHREAGVLPSHAAYLGGECSSLRADEEEVNCPGGAREAGLGHIGPYKGERWCGPSLPPSDEGGGSPQG